MRLTRRSSGGWGVIDTLAAFEKLADLEDAEAEGRLIILPKKARDEAQQDVGGTK